MKIEDIVYGEFEVEPVFEKLINTKEMQRLKKIHQGGACYIVNPEWNVTRYEHSVGVMLFVRRMGGTIEEQIAGLLHDISHTAFSHVVDFSLKNKNQDYHEVIYDEIIYKSAIPKIMEEEGYDFKKILFNEKQWTILEQSATKLCADRIDYTLRDLFHYGHITKDEIEHFLKHIEVFDGEVVITAMDVGEWFVENYYKEVIDFFMHPLNVYAYDRLAKAIEISLEESQITLQDLMKVDDYVEKKLCESQIEEVADIMKQLHSKVKVVENPIDYDIHQKQKIRTIDPTMKVKDEIFQLSKKSLKSKNMSEAALSKAKEGIFIKIIS